MLRDLAEQRFAQYLAELRQKIPAPGRRLERDLKALVRPFVPDASAADYLGYMLMVALVQDTGINRVVPMYNRIVPEANLGQRSRAAHAEAASAPRKLWPHDIKKMKAEYARRVAAGELHGAVTDLAEQFGVSTKTVSRHVKPKAKGK